VCLALAFAFTLPFALAFAGCCSFVIQSLSNKFVWLKVISQAGWRMFQQNCQMQQII
jgi:hypothetical protein